MVFICFILWIDLYLKYFDLDICRVVVGGGDDGKERGDGRDGLGREHTVLGVSVQRGGPQPRPW